MKKKPICHASGSSLLKARCAGGFASRVLKRNFLELGENHSRTKNEMSAHGLTTTGDEKERKEIRRGKKGKCLHALSVIVCIERQIH